jgi:hypothetical integral membrane protein (TIGR02206 family)
VAGTAGLLVAGAHLRGRTSGRRMATTLAVSNLAFGVASTGLGLVPFNAHHSLPLQICDFAWIAVAVALLTCRPTPTALTYYWGLTLSVQALVQPTLTEPFPQPEFFVFWGKHLCIVWGAVYVCLVLRHGPDWRGYRRAVAWTFGWLVLLLCLNPLLGSNYGYVNGKPKGTVLDWLGPWPWYVAVEMLIVITGWALITLPWAGRPRVRGTDDRCESPSG